MPMTIDHSGSLGLRASSFVQTVVSTTALSLNTGGVFPQRAWITCETNNVRYRLDGQDPVAGVAGTGHLLLVGGSLELIGETSIRNFRMIRGAAADATVVYTIEA